MKLKALLALSFTLLLLGCSVEKKARKAFNLGKYETAIDLYAKSLAANPRDGRASYFIAESYRLSNRVKESEAFYQKAGGPGIDKDTVKFYYAQALKSNGKYDEARQQFNDLMANAAEQKMKERARVELEGMDYINKVASSENFYKVKNLDLVNSPNAEYAPVYLNGELYITAARSTGKVYEASGTPFTDIYKMATRGANVDVTTMAPLDNGINSESVNDGCVTFTPDGKTMVFAKGNTGRKKDGWDVDLYISRFRSGSWTEPIPINVNTPIRDDDPKTNAEFTWDSTPAFSPDGRTIYFASNRKGGQGGTDIYTAHMDSRGRFTRIRNLGPQINTPGNDLFPYVSEDGKLYFASDGHPGFGGLDLFVVNRVNGKNTVENLGQPMNSTSDDFGIFLFKPDRGFFCSNREGGKGDDDVYTFVNEDPNLKIINYYLQGITYTKVKEDELQVLPNTKVSLLDSRGDVMQDFVTGNDGKFLFRIYDNEDYNLVAETDGYLTTREAYTTRGRGVDPRTLKDLVTNITFDTTLVLERKAKDVIVRLDNIYFGFDSANIRPDAASELDKLVQILTDNPEIKIEMGSHTDSVGSNDYNLALSQRRANATVQYLIRKGISADRLVAKGYGELRPIAPNTNPDGTDNKAGRDKNRRTEFKILEVGLVPKPIDEEETFDEDKYFRNDGNK